MICYLDYLVTYLKALLSDDDGVPILPFTLLSVLIDYAVFTKVTTDVVPKWQLDCAKKEETSQRHHHVTCIPKKYCIPAKSSVGRFSRRVYGYWRHL